jgi:hypothetical protein
MERLRLFELPVGGDQSAVLQPLPVIRFLFDELARSSRDLQLYRGRMSLAGTTCQRISSFSDCFRSLKIGVARCSLERCGSRIPISIMASRFCNALVRWLPVARSTSVNRACKPCHSRGL